MCKCQVPSAKWTVDVIAALPVRSPVTPLKIAVLPCPSSLHGGASATPIAPIYARLIQRQSKEACSVQRAANVGGLLFCMFEVSEQQSTLFSRWAGGQVERAAFAVDRFSFSFTVSTRRSRGHWARRNLSGELASPRQAQGYRY